MEPLKNQFSEALVCCMADHLKKHLRPFKRAAFIKAISPQLEKLELKERCQLIADTLHSVLPDDTGERHRIIRLMLHPDKDADTALQSNKDGVRGWGTLPLCTVVGQHGLQDFDASLNLLKYMTSYFSSELDVRYFILADQSRALNIMSSWLDDPDYHVRRLVSEGTRPRLPWAMQLPQLIADPSSTLPLLEALRDDETEYVRRSVANHLNDIAKDHPDLVAKLAKEWMKDADRNREKLLRHACRSLIKQGHPKALAVFGYRPPKLELQSLNIDNATVKLGSALDFSVRLHSLSSKKQSLIIDYVIHHQKNNGQLAAKVFKWTKTQIEPEQTLMLNRSHKMREVTTRRYYPGLHAVSLRINGQDFGYQEFALSCPAPR